MRMEPELVGQKGATCTLDSVDTANELRTPYRLLANGFTYVFSGAFVTVFLALGFAASVTVVTILAGLLGAFK